MSDQENHDTDNNRLKNNPDDLKEYTQEKGNVLLPEKETEQLSDTEENDFSFSDSICDAVESMNIPGNDKSEFLYDDPAMDKPEPETDFEAIFTSDPRSMSSDGAVVSETVKQRQKTEKKKIGFILLTTLLSILVLAAIAVPTYIYIVIHPYASYDKIMPNVYCAGINLGGMTENEAQAAIEEALRYPKYSVNVILPDGEYTFMPEQEGITVNSSAVVQAAYSYGRSDPSAYGMYRAYHLAEENEYNLTADTVLSYSTEDILSLASEIAQETAVDPSPSFSELDEESHTVVLTIGTTGYRIEAQTIYDAVCSAFDNMDFSDITLSYETVEIDLGELQTVCQTAASEYTVPAVEPTVSSNVISHTIELTVGSLGWTVDANALYSLALEAVESGAYGTSVSLSMNTIEPAAVDITEAYEELACDPTEPYYASGTVQAGTSGYTLDLEAANDLILQADYGEHLSIDMTEVAPSMTVEEMQSLLFRDQLSSYDTAHTSIANRTTNLTLACKAIDGTVINPGETFSFNSVVGERTEEKGYKDATVYVGDESAEEIGGGVCQVASTIYDAALYAEMEITSREPHTFFVTYVPGGLDATIYWGSLDFCFKNTSEYPIRINASVSGGYVHISIDGTKTNDHVVKLTSKQLSSTDYSTVYEYSSSMKKGTQKETVSPYTGYVYEAYQYIYDGDGNLLETNYLGKSTYKKRDRVITIGTG